ncbi:hypothetical protein KR067_010697, partial [Drosophila pandora]
WLRGKRFGDEVKDYELDGAPSDSVSALQFSGKSCPYLGLSAASWDETVRFWRIDRDECVAIPKAMTKLSSPPLDTSWNEDGTRIYVGDCEGKLLAWDLMTDKVTQVGSHEKGVRSCHLVAGSATSYLMTTSWDKSVKFWDPRMSSLAASLLLPERSYAADVCHPLAAVACADNTVTVISLENGPVERCRYELKPSGSMSSQVRALAIHKMGQGEAGMAWAVSKTDGWVNFQHLLNRNRDFSLKCHVDLDVIHNVHNAYAVNDLSFQPGSTVLATVGSDGQYQFWDHSTRYRLQRSSLCDQPLTKCAFDAHGDIFAYAVGYDWSMGHEYFDPKVMPQIFLKSMVDPDLPSRQ